MRTAIALVCCLMTAVGCVSRARSVPTVAADVRRHGAVGDGRTSDTAAFVRALAAGNYVTVPAGRYVVGALDLRSDTTLHLDVGAVLVGSPDVADYPVARIRWEGRWRDGHKAILNARGVHNVTIEGAGRIEGDPKLADLRNPRGPCLVETVDCTNVRLAGFSTSHRHMWSIHLTTTDHVRCEGLTIRSDPSRSIGDGIDVDSCSDVTIDHCDIDTGDDAIALKSGRGTEGFTQARPTKNVTITDCKLASSFAGLAIGTEMSGGVRGVTVRNCTFTRGSNAIFIKSRIGRGGVIENIDCRDLVANGPKCFLRIDLMTKGIRDESPVQGDAGIPQARNLRFENVHSTCDVFYDDSQVSPKSPIVGLTMRNVDGTTRRLPSFTHASNVVVGPMRLKETR